MSQITELELQNLRHLMSGYDTSYCKMKEYAEDAEDEKLRQFFEQGAQTAKQNKEKLMGFLQ